MLPKIVLSIILTLMLGFPASASAQRNDIFANPKNLQVLPKDISPAQLASQMRRFKLALGVECSHCHQGTDNRSFSDFDFAADAKDTKLTAREMMQMVSAVNAMVSGFKREPDRTAVEITCVTCHRGNFRPVMMKDELADTYALHDGNIDTVIARYRELREKHYGGFAFDFGEFPVSGLAFTLNKEGEVDDAIKLQKMNEQFHPDSPNIPSGMGFIYREAGHLELAADAFRRSLEADPTGRWVIRQLAEVEKLISEK